MITQVLASQRQQKHLADARPVNVLAQPSGLYVVTPREICELGEAFSAGHLPSDLEAKLSRLAEGNLLERYVAQSCRLLISLVMAQEQGLYNELSPADREQVLRTLAYVRKDEDVIPDYWPDGFRDDAQEIRKLDSNLSGKLQRFKHWHLRNRVPGIWLDTDKGATEVPRTNSEAV